MADRVSVESDGIARRMADNGDGTWAEALAAAGEALAEGDRITRGVDGIPRAMRSNGDGTFAEVVSFEGAAGEVTSVDGETGAVDLSGTYAKPATSGTLAARPAASVIGQRYLATDVGGGTEYESLNGSTWTQLAPGITEVSAEATARAAADALLTPFTEVVNTVAASGAAQTIPAPATASISRVTLTANCTLTFPAAAAGKGFTLVLVQDATGSRTVTWPGTVKWAGGTAPTLSTGAGKIDYLSFVCTDGTNWAGFVAGLDLR